MKELLAAKDRDHQLIMKEIEDMELVQYPKKIIHH